MYTARPLPVLSTARPDNKRINLTLASVTPLALVPSSVRTARGQQQAARRPAACAADATAGYAPRYLDSEELFAKLLLKSLSCSPR